MSIHEEDTYACVYTHESNTCTTRARSCNGLLQIGSANEQCCAFTCMPSVALNSLFDKAVQVSFAAVPAKARSIG